MARRWCNLEAAETEKTMMKKETRGEQILEEEELAVRELADLLLHC